MAKFTVVLKSTYEVEGTNDQDTAFLLASAVAAGCQHGGEDLGQKFQFGKRTIQCTGTERVDVIRRPTYKELAAQAKETTHDDSSNPDTGGESGSVPDAHGSV